MWIVQEIMVAKEVQIQCGSQNFPFKDFTNSINTLQRLLRSQGDKSEPNHMTFVNEIKDTGAGKIIWMKDILDMHVQGDHDITLRMLVLLCKNQECSDIRDKLFGLFSLLSLKHDEADSFATNIVADYFQTLAEVCSMAVEWVAMKKRLDGENILAFVSQLEDIMDLDLTSDVLIKRLSRLVAEAKGFKTYLGFEAVYELILERTLRQPRTRNLWDAYCILTERIFDLSTFINLPYVSFNYDESLVDPSEFGAETMLDSNDSGSLLR